MATTHTVVNVRNLTAEGNAKADQPVWMVEMSADGSSTPTYAHCFPHETFGWRVAEYGFDPADFDTLIDVVMHEPHVNLQHTDPTFLYNTDQATARAAHLARVADIKKTVTHTDPRKLLDAIRQAYDPADPTTDERRKRVRWARSGRTDIDPWAHTAAIPPPSVRTAQTTANTPAGG